MAKKAFYLLFTGKDNQYYFNLKAGNNEIILQSEGYISKQGALNGIKSVQIHCTDDRNFVKKISKDDSPFFVLRAKNNEIIGKSEMYSSTQMMLKGIESVKFNGITITIHNG
ncbi:MAG: YegP family protein [Oleispira sp.]|nr:YegP family protein [Oleispira sp.]